MGIGIGPFLLCMPEIDLGHWNWYLFIGNGKTENAEMGTGQMFLKSMSSQGLTKSSLV